MKKIQLFLAAIVAAIMVSCSSASEPESKFISPTTTEFSSGKLAKYIEVKDLPSELSYAVKEGSIETQYIRLKVELKMKKDGFTDVDAQDIGFISLLSVATINLVDANGTTVQDISVKDDEVLKLKKLLTGKEGDTEDIIFEGKFNNSTDAPKWYESIEKFTPYLSADVVVSSEETETEVEETEEVSSSDDSENENWDEVLDAYEEYADKTISYAQKIANGDMSVISEYPELMEKAKEFGDKMQGAKSNMSSSQWSRYMKITEKLAKSASKAN